MNLRHEKTNFRYGPDMSFPLKFTWHGMLLPVELIKHHKEWVFVRDSEGAKAWVQARMLAKRQMVLALKDLDLRLTQDAQSKRLAYLQKGALLKLEVCKQDMCKIKTLDKDLQLKGWVSLKGLWGAA